MNPASHTHLPSKGMAFTGQVAFREGEIVGLIEGKEVGLIVGLCVGACGRGFGEHTRFNPLPIGENPELQMQFTDPCEENELAGQFKHEGCKSDSQTYPNRAGP